MEKLDKIMNYRIKEVKVQSMSLISSETCKVMGRFMVFWEDENLGFGNVTIYMDDNGEWICDGEHMSKEFVKEVFCKLVDTLKFE